MRDGGLRMSDVQRAPRISAWTPPGAPVRALPAAGGEPLTIGLVNNMHGAGFRDADRQFRAILHAAAAESMPELIVQGYVMTDDGPDVAGSRYRPAAAIADEQPDGLIVTGAEPSTEDLRDEAYYPALTRLIDHAIARRIPMLFSCLASHVAVLHLSGVARRRLARKCHGVLRFDVMGEHPLLADTTGRIAVPHSRWNSLDEGPLTRRGYRVLAASARGGVDRFVHDHAPGCLFLQGHPEYESASLALEYRRDVRRYLTGAAPDYPTMPVRYFDAPTRAALFGLQRALRRQRDPIGFDSLPLPTEGPGARPVWRDHAVRSYRNWLDAVMVGRRSRVGTG